MKINNKRGFTLIELIIVIAILGIIALIAIPNLSGIRQRSQVSADKRTAEQIGKAVRIWATDVDASGTRAIPLAGGTDDEAPAVYDDGYGGVEGTDPLFGLCNTYISKDYEAKSFGSTPGDYYVTSQGAGTNNEDQKILIWIGDAIPTAGDDGDYDSDDVTVGVQPLTQTNITYAGGAAGWAYLEQ